MSVVRHIAAECRPDRVFAVTTLGPGVWSVIALAPVALNAFDRLPSR